VQVIDFNVYYDQGSQVGTFVLLEEGVTTTFYQTTISITAGETYSFKVTARNTVGSSLESVPVSILAAKPPDSPTNLQNVPA
jgi:hypothetical protein